MYFYICIFGLGKSVLVNMRFLLQSIMMCTPKHTHRKYRPGDDCRDYNFEVRYPASTVI